MITKTKTERSTARPGRSASLTVRGLVGGSVIALACTLGAGAQAISLGGEVQATGPDPFTNCTRDNVKSQEAAYDGVNYPNTPIEPWVAVDPTNGKRLLIGHQQDRWSNGGSRGLVGNLSTDGGGTWSQTIPGDVSECTGGKFRRSSDPWVTFSPDGTVFFFSLVAEQVQATSGLGERHGGMLVSRSADGGATWGVPTALILDNSTHNFNDKNSITADPTANGHVYAVWDRLSIFPASQADTSGDQLLSQLDGVEIARQLAEGLTTAAAGGAPFFTFSFIGPTFFSTTANNGDTWSTAAPIFDPGINAQTIDNLVVVQPSGDVLDFFTNITNTGALSIKYIRSKNKGATWSGPTLVSDIQVFRNAVGVIAPFAGDPVRDGAILYAVAVDPSNGNLYVTWQDDRASFPSSGTCKTTARTRPVDSIAFSQSLDGGKTWSSPVQINQTPNVTNPCLRQAFIPAVVVASDGTVVVTYYDFRNDTNTPAGFEATDYFALFCKTACNNPASWGNEKRLTSSSFNILDAPVAPASRGHFLGDYMGLVANSSDKVFPVFGKATGHNTTADFTNVITLP